MVSTYSTVTPKKKTETQFWGGSSSLVSVFPYSFQVFNWSTFFIHARRLMGSLPLRDQPRELAGRIRTCEPWVLPSVCVHVIYVSMCMYPYMSICIGICVCISIYICISICLYYCKCMYRYPCMYMRMEMEMDMDMDMYNHM